MGNKFREKTVEEGLDGDVAREALKEAVARGPKSRTTGNRRRTHDVEENRKKNEETAEREETKTTKGNRRRTHEEEKNEEWRAETSEPSMEAEEKEANTNEQTAVTDEVEDNDDTPQITGRGGRVAKGVAKVLGGDILADKLVMKQIPLLLLCLVFLLMLVANRYQVESLSRRKIAVQERMNELREQQIQLQKKNQNSIRISQIRDDLKREKNLGILPTPPNVI